MEVGAVGSVGVMSIRSGVTLFWTDVVVDEFVEFCSNLVMMVLVIPLMILDSNACIRSSIARNCAVVNGSDIWVVGWGSGLGD